MRKSDAIYDVSLEANLSPSLIPVSELHHYQFIKLTITLKMANISTPIPQLKLNDGTSIPMLAYGSKQSPAAVMIVLTIPSRDCLVQVQ